MKVKMSRVLCSKVNNFHFFGTSLGTLSVLSVRRKPCLSMDAMKAHEPSGRDQKELGYRQGQGKSGLGLC